MSAPAGGMEMSALAAGTVAEVENLTCAICFRLYFDPITAPCQHSYCRDCLIKSFKKNNKLCPLCRLELHDWDLKSTAANPELTQVLASEKFAELYAQREKEGMEERDQELNLLQVQISLGNLHQHVPSASGGNSNKWTFFLMSREGEDLTKYIKCVVVYLHPTFHPSKITMTEEPFMFSRLGWGVFVLRVVVQYHAHLEKPDDEFHHMLSFQHNGSATSHDLEFDRKRLEAHDGNEPSTANPGS